MTKNLVLGFILIMGSGSGSTTELKSQEKTRDDVRKPLAMLTGDSSKITKPKTLLVSNNQDWLTLWREHRTGSATKKENSDEAELIEFNFQEVLIIAIFDGNVTACHNYSLPSLIESEKAVRLQITLNCSQTGHSGDPEVDKRTFATRQTWGVFVIPRTNKEIILEQNAQILIGEKPIWEVWKRFPKVDSIK